MIFKRIESQGLSHYSYLIGHRGQAAVIDPRRDCRVYVEEARRSGLRIRHILETHRNEDYVIGSLELAEQTGAEIWHADAQLDYSYGQAAEDGQTWKIGGVKLKALHSPGHTPGHMSYLLHDSSGNPWILFSGDALFAGDTGRTDLLGMDQAEKQAEQLYDTLTNVFFPLGDGVILCPAHGPGSVCGSAISDRTWTTLGLEKKYNPKLQIKNRSDFIKAAVQELPRPPYFRKMEELNVSGPPVLGNLPFPAPLAPGEFSEKSESAQVLDTRMELCFTAAHVPGALSIWAGGISGYAGWFLNYDKPLLLINENDDPETVIRLLIRMGYDNITGTLAGGMLAWHTAGKKSESVPTLTAQSLCTKLDKEEEVFILDVRGEGELESQGIIPGAMSIPLGRFPERINEIPSDKKVHIFCGSGLRSTIAASFLMLQGRKNPAVVLGGFAGWNSTSCPITRG